MRLIGVRRGWGSRGWPVLLLGGLWARCADVQTPTAPAVEPPPVTAALGPIVEIGVASRAPADGAAGFSTQRWGALLPADPVAARRALSATLGATLELRAHGPLRITAGQSGSVTLAARAGATAEGARLLSLSSESPLEISAPGCVQERPAVARCSVPALTAGAAHELLVTVRVPPGAGPRPRRLFVTWGTRTLEWPVEILPDRWSLTSFGVPLGVQTVVGQPSVTSWRVRNSTALPVSGLLLSIMAPPPWPLGADPVTVELVPDVGVAVQFRCARTFASPTWLLHDCLVPAAFPARSTTTLRLLHPPAAFVGAGWHTLALTAPEGTRFLTGSPFLLGTFPYSVTAAPPPPLARWPLTRLQCAATRVGRCWRLSPAPPDTLRDAGGVIQAALDSLGHEGGGELQLAPGRWPLARRGTAFLVLRSRVHLSGSGPTTILEPLPNQGAYAAVLATDTLWGRTRVDDVTVRDLTLRQDPDRNPTGLVVPGRAEASLIGVRVLQGERWALHRIVFDPFSGVHAVTFNGPMTDLMISENLFRFRPAPTTVLDSLRFDNAAVYVQGSHVQILGNRFEAPTSARARAAIETHARPERLAFNTIDGWRTGITLASSTAPRPGSTTHDIVVTRNTIRGAVQGIRLWPATGDTLRQVLVSENDLTLQPWLQQLGGPTAFAIVGASSALSGSDGRIENLVITRNRVRVEAVGPTGIAFPSPSMTGLIALLGTGSTRGVTIEDNEFAGSVGPVVRLGTPAMRGVLSDVVVRRNRFTQVVPLGAVGLHNTAVVRIDGQVGALSVTGNTFQAGALPSILWPCLPAGLGPVNGVPTRLWWAPVSVTGVVRIRDNVLVPAMQAGCWRQRLLASTSWLDTDW